MEYGGPGYWIKMQRPAMEGGYDFASTGECVMQPRQAWPAKLREWVESSLKYTATDASRDLQMAASNHGQGRLLSAEEMFAEGGFLSKLGSWLERAHEVQGCLASARNLAMRLEELGAAGSGNGCDLPVGLWAQKLHDDFLRLFGFPVLDFFPGVPYVGNFSVMRKLYEAGSPEALAGGAFAKASAKAAHTEHGLLAAWHILAHLALEVCPQELSLDTQREIPMQCVRELHPIFIPSNSSAAPHAPQVKAAVVPRSHGASACKGARGLQESLGSRPEFGLDCREGLHSLRNGTMPPRARHNAKF
ncbi:unnamed protein product [Symbiodinium natans]|uniref:Uncharacterized protein n=1 Tax=Symbiodinium natans TaxID=878477 RepID=A0A812S8E4_9DINO|nr:unnamed protein product [Symbiodinium natans]